MTPIDFDNLQSVKPGCLSELTLQRLAAGELPEDRRATARRHLEGCAPCSARLGEAEEGFARWPEADPARMLSAIRRGLDERPRQAGLLTRLRDALRRRVVPAGLAAAAAIALLVVVPGPPPSPEESLRLKGEIGLHVFRHSNGQAVAAFDGEAVEPGEPLQFQVDLATESAVQLVGVEADGDLYVVWPRPEGTARLPAGRGQPLPGAVSLDESPGADTFHLVACDPSVAATQCQSRGANAPPACARGCLTTSFALKRAR